MKLKRTVMVVDDSEIVLEVTRLALEGAGFRVLTRNRPNGCIALMLQEEPDLVLVDVAMPGVGGDTLVRCFGTAHPASRSIVLLHSSLPESVLRSKAASSGAHGFIQKANDPAELVREVRRWLERAASSGTFKAVQVSEPSPQSSRLSENPTSRTRRKGSPSPLALDVDGSFGRTPSVLLVDREMLVLSSYRELLSRDGFAFEFALSGAHALGLILSESPPDIVVTDMRLGEFTGRQIYERALAADSRWKDRFVFVADVGDAFQVPQFAGSVLRRPVAAEALRSAIGLCLDRTGNFKRRALG